MGSLFAIVSIHDFLRISTDFVLVFPQYDLDVYLFMDIPFGMGVNRNRV